MLFLHVGGQVKDLINKALEGVNLKEGLSRRHGTLWDDGHVLEKT